MFNSTVIKVVVIIAVITGITNIRSFGYSGKNSLLLDNGDTIKRTDPPFLGFYTKYLDCDGISIRSASVVDDKALLIAYAKIKLMLLHMPITRKNLIKDGAELHIIGKGQQTSDLPELSDKKGKSYIDNGILTDIDKRTRGVGGLYASCGEENLLQLPNDRYAGGSDICIHEFAHTIMDYGFDQAIRQKIQHRLDRAIATGLWKGAYASSNSQEYWAELSMWYFGKHGEYLHGTFTPAAGPDGLKNYDNDGYKLLDSIYSGLMQPAINGRVSIPVQKGAVSGNSTEKTEFTFTNHKSTPVKLYWIDWSGTPKLYSTVKPGRSIIQSTFVSHVWLFENDKGEPIIYMRINDPPCSIDLKD